MSYSVKLEMLAKDKEESRKIVNEIISFGVNENQKLDIIFGLCLHLENNQALKDITSVLKKYREVINKEEETDNNISDSDKPKIILE